MNSLSVITRLPQLVSRPIKSGQPYQYEIILKDSIRPVTHREAELFVEKRKQELRGHVNHESII